MSFLLFLYEYVNFYIERKQQKNKLLIKLINFNVFIIFK